MYCTIEDLQKILPVKDLIELTDFDGTGEINEEVLNDVLSSVSNVINGYVSVFAKAPVEHPLLSNIAAQMAVYELYCRRDIAHEIWEKRYDRCVSLLEKIAQGKIQLGSDREKTANRYKWTAI